MVDELQAVVFQVDGWGWTGLVASPRGLRFLGLPLAGAEPALQRLRRHYREAVVLESNAFLQEIAEQVRAYLGGRLQKFTVEVDLRGHTAFELGVWAATTRVAYGETRTYGWLAGQIGGGPGTAQAVGAALGNNPVPLVVPCHRIIGSDGSLHGFGGGLDLKARLLALESHQMAFALHDEA